jgi:hypothetical protein
VLLCRDFKDTGLDLMFTYGDDGEDKFLFLGHFNSGKVQE